MAEDGQRKWRRPYYPNSTIQQRKIAMEVYEAEGLKAAVQASGISKDTIYRWLPRWREKGVEGLIDDPKTRTPHTIYYISTKMENRIVEMRRQEGWGKKRIAHEITRERSEWSVCANTVRHVLERHDEWHPDPPLGKAQLSARRSRRTS